MNDINRASAASDDDIQLPDARLRILLYVRIRHGYILLVGGVYRMTHTSSTCAGTRKQQQRQSAEEVIIVQTIELMIHTAYIMRYKKSSSHFFVRPAVHIQRVDLTQIPAVLAVQEISAHDLFGIQVVVVGR